MSDPPTPHWRPMVPADLPGVEAIAARLHAAHPERPEVFAERLALAPEGCRVLSAGDGALLGFAIGHPWVLAAPPPLDSLLGRLPARPECWHLHDIAVLEEARGQGHPATLLRDALAAAAARGLGWGTLVAVPGLDGYWRRQGFVEREGSDAGPGAALASYGAGARFMLRRLPRPLRTGA